jgi:hypothetical protein
MIKLKKKICHKSSTSVYTQRDRNIINLREGKCDGE